MYIISLTVLYFFCYAFLGWVSETIYNLITVRRFNNGGFLLLPVLPIYGFGGIAIILFVTPYLNNPFVVFLLSITIASAIEYAGHWLIDKIFRIKLWDYSDRRFNLHGRICLENSLGFGILALFLVYIIQPFLQAFAPDLPDLLVVTLALTLIFLLVVDFVNFVVTIIRLRTATVTGTLQEAERVILTEIKKIMLSKTPIKIRLKKAKILLLKLHRLNIKRLHRAFPHKVTQT